MPIWSNVSFHNRNSPLIEHLLFFHDHRIVLVFFIITISLTPILRGIYQINFNHFMLENQQIEVFWTSFPAVILIFVAIPSLKTLYIIEESSNPLISIKTIGSQWFWRYEYSNTINNSYNSIIYPSIKIRLQSSTNRLIIPSSVTTRLMVRSKDVIHSWAIPSLGVKADATPGKINQLTLTIKRPGIFLGRCSEICGAGHSFMPITLESPNIKNFK